MRLAIPALMGLAFALPALGQTAPPPPGATSCSGCHGAGALSLEGWTAEQIAAAMAAFRSGDRPATLMNRISMGFSAEESHAIAAWIAGS